MKNCYIFVLTITNQNANDMNTAKDLKVGSIIETNVFNSISGKSEPKQVTISRCTGYYVWFKNSGYERIGRNTIDKFPTLYKIVSI